MGGSHLVVVGGLLIAAASLVAGAQALGDVASVFAAYGLVAPWHVGSSQTRDRTRVSCIGRQSLIHWATREVWKQGVLTTDLPGKFPVAHSFIHQM